MALLALSAPVSASAQAVSYSYDGLGRLVDALYPDGTCLTYAYDAAGNRTQSTAATLPAVTAPPGAITANESLATTFDPRIGVPACGQSLTVSAVGTASHGTASPLAGGAGIVYTPTAGYVGTDSFTYQLTRGGVASPSGTIAVNVQAPTLPPVALNYNQSIIATVPPAAQPVVSFNVSSLLSDPYGYTPTVTAVTNGANGTVGFHGNEITYTNPNTYNHAITLSDSFTYTVNDGYGNTATATVYLQFNFVTTN